MRMDGLELTVPMPRDQNPDFDDTGSLWHRYRYLAEKPSSNVLLSSPFSISRELPMFLIRGIRRSTLAFVLERTADESMSEPRETTCR